MDRSSFLSTSWLLRASKKISAASRRKKIAFQRAYMFSLLCSSLSISVGRKSRSSAAVARGDTCDSAAPDSAVRALPPSGVPESRMIVPRDKVGSRVGDETDVGKRLKVIEVVTGMKVDVLTRKRTCIGRGHGRLHVPPLQWMIRPDRPACTSCG